MSEFDLIIRGGTVVDGSGGEPFVGDVAVRGGRIAAIGQVDGSAADEIDAAGKLVTPGFVDIHTHYDGQAIWSERLDPSSDHGVTTVVLGNCGVGFAPCRRSDHEALMSVMEGVEDIPVPVMSAGLTWDWETFPEFLDALDRRERDIDVAVYLPHSPARVYVMGARGADREEATDEDLNRLARLMGEALDAGALGFATSRLRVHRTGQGDYIPSYGASRRELMAVGKVMREKGRGLLQIVPDIGESYKDEIALIIEIAEQSGRPVTFSLAQTNDKPEAWREALAAVDKANNRGLSIFPQVFPRPVGMILGLDTTVHPFSLSPTYVTELATLPMADRVARMRDPEVRARLLAETPADPTTPIYAMARDFRRIFPLTRAGDYDPSPEQSVFARAAKAGVSPLDHVYDLLLEKGGYALLYAALANFAQGTLKPVYEMMADPNTLIALGDGGAHYGVVCDANYPTFVLCHWTRDRQGEQLTLPQAVKALARDPALAVGLADRGLIAPGCKADINVIDYDKLTLNLPRIIEDLPGGGRRLMQYADGYVATVVSGKPIRRDGARTGALPGRLVRGGNLS